MQIYKNNLTITHEYRYNNTIIFITSDQIIPFGRWIMAHFYLLHLSDLHLEAQDDYPERLPYVAENLIKHAAERLKDKDNIILVITGDIIHRGNYVKNKNLAISFFTKLKNTLDNNKCKIISIQIVPGNHDKDFGKKPDEPNENKLLSVALQNIVEFNEHERHIRNLLKGSYDEYMKLRTQISDIFLLDPQKINDVFLKSDKKDNCEYNATYGVDVITVYDKNEIDNEIVNDIDPIKLVFLILTRHLLQNYVGKRRKESKLLGKRKLMILLINFQI